MEISKSESIDLLAKALAEAQGEMPPVMMNAVNPFLHSKYADLGAIIETSKPVLSKHSLSFSQVVFTEDNKVGLNTLLMHSSGQWIASGMSLPMGEEKGKSLAQVAGSVITYLRRYSLSAILGIYTDEDTDGNDKKTKLENKEPEKMEKPSEPENKKPSKLVLARKMIVDKAKSLGGFKNEDVVKVLKEYEPDGNPNKIKDQAKLSELYTKLNSMKIQEKE